MMSSAIAMEIVCMTSIGSISSEKIAGAENCFKCQIVVFYCKLNIEIFKMYWRTFCSSPN